MSFVVEISERAMRVIAEKRLWYLTDEKHGGIDLADRWARAFDLAIGSLATQPERFGMAPENGRWETAVIVRQMFFRPWKSGVGWRVLFAINEGLKVVKVMDVRHERQRRAYEDDAG